MVQSSGLRAGIRNGSLWLCGLASIETAQNGSVFCDMEELFLGGSSVGGHCICLCGGYLTALPTDPETKDGMDELGALVKSTST